MANLVSCQGSTTAVLSCVVLQRAAFRSRSVFSTLPPGWFSKFQGGLAPHLLHQLHWLPVWQWITYKLTVLAFIQAVPHSITCMSEPFIHSAPPCSHSVLLQSSAAVRIIPQDYFLGMSFPLHCSYNVELCWTFWQLLTHWQVKSMLKTHLLNQTFKP